jgi:hypothetical protein
MGGGLFCADPHDAVIGNGEAAGSGAACYVRGKLKHFRRGLKDAQACGEGR